MSVIDEYLKKFDPEKQKQLNRIREIARKIVPDAEDSISYGMPTLKYKGKAFLGFDVHKDHIGIYPYGGEEIEKLKDKLAGFETTKGSIHVPFDREIPEEILEEVLTHRINRLLEPK